MRARQRSTLLLLTAAAALGACTSRRSHADRALAERVSGCWKIMRADGSSPNPYVTFWDSGIRLERLTSQKTHESGSEDYDVLPLAPIPDSLDIDTAGVISTWRVAAPDSVFLQRSVLLNGHGFSFAVRGDSLMGVLVTFTDVAEHNRTAPRQPVRGHRIPCPAR
jgi:hypothetical protein